MERKATEVEDVNSTQPAAVRCAPENLHGLEKKWIQRGVACASRFRIFSKEAKEENEGFERWREGGTERPEKGTGITTKKKNKKKTKSKKGSDRQDKRRHYKGCGAFQGDMIEWK